jgi:hypothetical protein
MVGNSQDNFTIEPLHGYCSAGSSVIINVEFHPKNAEHLIKREVIHVM